MGSAWSVHSLDQAGGPDLALRVGVAGPHLATQILRGNLALMQLYGGWGLTIDLTICLFPDTGLAGRDQVTWDSLPYKPLIQKKKCKGNGV